MYTNTDNSVLSKFDELLARIVQEDPDIVCLVEVKPKNGAAPAKENLQIAGYDLFTNNFENPETRGVITYTKSYLKANLVETEVTSRFDDCLWLSVGDPSSKPLLIGTIYRSGSINKARKLDYNLQSMINDMAKDSNYSEILITGDFNYPDITWNPETDPIHPANHPDTVFKDCLQDAFLHQHVKHHTRIRNNQRSLLDLVLTRDDTLIDKIHHNSHIGVSDHLTLNFLYNSNCLTDDIKSAKKRSSLNYNKTNIPLMTSLLEHDWQKLFHEKSTDEAYNIFVDIYQKAVKRSVPTFKNNNKPQKPKPEWMKAQTLRIVSEKHHLWTRYQYTKQQSDYMKYTTIRNKVTRALEKDRKTFERRLAREIKTNIKAFWKYVNSFKKNSPKIPELKNKDNTFSKTDKEKADTLNTQFQSVFSVEDLNNLPSLKKQKISRVLSEINITEEMVLKKLNNLRTDKSCGADNIHPYILKNLAKSLVKPLTLIYNISMQSGELPYLWKNALVTPLYKKGARNLPENYRPISLTSIPCKILESIIIDFIIDHLEANNLKNPDQHGFTKKRSTDTNLLQAINIWSDALSHGIPIDVVYLDYEKAFDKVPHGRLALQLENFGITSQPLTWIKSFLNNRTQQVTINGVLSEPAAVTSGVPQGSVLGPALFLIYISDVTSHVENFISLFADDSKLFCKVIDQNLSTESLQRDITALSDWSDRMLMKFNVGKCHVLHLGSKNPQKDYYMPNAKKLTYPTLEVVDKEKDLGVYIDNKLNFYHHMEAKLKKANQMLGIVKRTFKYMEPKTFSLLYKTIIRPHLEYASITWSPTTKQYQDKLEKLQRRATRIVPSISHLSYSERLKQLKLPTLAYRRLRTGLIFLYKASHDLVDVDLNTHCGTCLTSNALTPSLSRNTRGHSLKLQIQHHTGARQKFFTTHTIPIWNKLNENTVNAPSLNSFKNQLAKDSGMPDQFDYTFSY